MAARWQWKRSVLIIGQGLIAGLIAIAEQPHVSGIHTTKGTNLVSTSISWVIDKGRATMAFSG
jgi:hypothetical protein